MRATVLAKLLIEKAAEYGDHEVVVAALLDAGKLMLGGPWLPAVKAEGPRRACARFFAMTVEDPAPFFMMFATGAGKVALGLVNPKVGELAAFSLQASADCGRVPWAICGASPDCSGLGDDLIA